MGTLFKRPPPKNTLPFSGERLTSEVSGQIEAEHYHRYFLARFFCREKNVLDIASGEGYGSYILAQVAGSVTGVDNSETAVEHAKEAYPGMTFLVGSAEKIPLPDRSIDVVVSFETFEHFGRHEEFLSEVVRVLRSEGLLIVSTPDTELYLPSVVVNPFHVKEERKADFQEKLKQFFPCVAMYSQRAMLGSAIVKDTYEQVHSYPAYFEKRGPTHFEEMTSLQRAPYAVAFCSFSPMQLPDFSLYFETGEPYSEFDQLRRTFKEETDRLVSKLNEVELNLSTVKSEFGKLQESYVSLAAGNEILSQKESSFDSIEATLRGELERLTVEMARAAERDVLFADAEKEFNKEVLRLRQQSMTLTSRIRELSEPDGVGFAQRRAMSPETPTQREEIEFLKSEIDRLNELLEAPASKTDRVTKCMD